MKSEKTLRGLEEGHPLGVDSPRGAVRLLVTALCIGFVVLQPGGVRGRTLSVSGELPARVAALGVFVVTGFLDGYGVVGSEAGGFPAIFIETSSLEEGSKARSKVVGDLRPYVLRRQCLVASGEFRPLTVEFCVSSCRSVRRSRTYSPVVMT